MQHQLDLSEQGSCVPRDSLIEAMWETLIALAMVAAIGIGIISLAAHLNEARTVVAGKAVAGTRTVHPGLSSSVAGLGSQAATRLE